MIFLISATSSYATTNYVINASKVAYLDNSNLGVDNVQAAIDGTCSKIDYRLNSLEQISEQHELSYIDNPNYKVNGVNGVHSHWYQVGSLVIVNISLAITTPSTATTVEVIKDLPKPKYNMNYISFGAEQPTTSPPVGVLNTNGILRIMGGTAGHIFEGQLVYTVE